MPLCLDDVEETKRRRENSASPNPDMSMMRVAVAGTGGLARLIAHFIDEDTSHHVIFLSRTVRLCEHVKPCIDQERRAVGMMDDPALV